MIYVYGIIIGIDVGILFYILILLRRLRRIRRVLSYLEKQLNEGEFRQLSPTSLRRTSERISERKEGVHSTEIDDSTIENNLLGDGMGHNDER